MPGLVDVLCGHPEYSLCARRSILLLFCFFAKTCSRDSKSNGIRMPDDREAGRHAPRSHAKFKRAPMQFQYRYGGFGTPRTPHARPLLKKFLSHPFLTWPPACGVRGVRLPNRALPQPPPLWRRRHASISHCRCSAAVTHAPGAPSMQRRTPLHAGAPNGAASCLLSLGAKACKPPLAACVASALATASALRHAHFVS